MSCTVLGCTNVLHAKGLCAKHYQRVYKHGDVEGGRDRVKSKHPLWERWKSLHRFAEHRSGLDPRWHDFWLFVEDVGEQPTSKSRLYRLDMTQPYGRENFEWRESVLEESQLQDKNAYQRAWRLKRPRHAQLHQHRKLYGLKKGEYEKLLIKQNGVCAICKKPETNRHAKSGEVMMLAVDHAHDETNRIRGLLCTGCNTGLGCFGDDVSRLEAAIAYLRAHALAPQAPAA